MIKEYIIKIDEDPSKKDIHGGYPLIEPPLELIRCKDCTEYQEWADGKICMWLGSYYGDVPPDWFCANAKREDK